MMELTAGIDNIEEAPRLRMIWHYPKYRFGFYNYPFALYDYAQRDAPL